MLTERSAFLVIAMSSSSKIPGDEFSACGKEENNINKNKHTIKLMNKHKTDSNIYFNQGTSYGVSTFATFSFQLEM